MMKKTYTRPEIETLNIALEAHIMGPSSDVPVDSSETIKQGEESEILTTPYYIHPTFFGRFDKEEWER